MALVNNQKLGTWLTYVMTVRIFDSKKFATQSTADGGFIPRGRGIMLNADAVKETGIDNTLIGELEPSDDYGTSAPLTFTTPDGYTKVIKNGTPVYYPDALVEQNPTLVSGAVTATGTRSADTMFSKAWAWIQANPLQAAIIAFLLYAFIIEPMFLKKKGKKSILGKLF